MLVITTKNENYKIENWLTFAAVVAAPVVRLADLPALLAIEVVDQAVAVGFPRIGNCKHKGHFKLTNS